MVGGARWTGFLLTRGWCGGLEPLSVDERRSRALPGVLRGVRRAVEVLALGEPPPAPPVAAQPAPPSAATLRRRRLRELLEQRRGGAAG